MNPKSLTILALACAAVCKAAFGFSITPGDYYSSDTFSQTISHYTPTGALVDSYTFSSSLADSVHGIQFHDGNLFAVAEVGTGFNILKLNSNGQVTPLFQNVPLYIGGNISYGKIAVDGSDIFVAGQNSLLKFNLNGSGEPQTIYRDNQVYDVKVLPSGNLLVASAYSIVEITPTGSVVKQIAPNAWFTDLRGVEFDPKTSTVFATALGYSNNYFQLMAIDYNSGAIEKTVSHWYADDLFLTDGGELLVGSSAVAPQIFDLNLNGGPSLGEIPQLFVTQATPWAAVPEPATYGIISGLLLGALIGFRKIGSRA
jgi:hypothetical protein